MGRIDQSTIEISFDNKVFSQVQCFDLDDPINNINKRSCTFRFTKRVDNGCCSINEYYWISLNINAALKLLSQLSTESNANNIKFQLFYNETTKDINIRLYTIRNSSKECYQNLDKDIFDKVSLISYQIVIIIIL